MSHATAAVLTLGVLKVALQHTSPAICETPGPDEEGPMKSTHTRLRISQEAEPLKKLHPYSTVTKPGYHAVSHVRP